MPVRCIWCGRLGAERSVEHIIPEAIGCPPDLILAGGIVCRRCNNGLAHLDRAVADEFDIVSFMAGVPRKGGKPPVIASRGNVVGSHFQGAPTLSFNMERHAVQAHDGSRLAPFRDGSERDIHLKLAVDGSVAKASASVAFGQSPKFLRGLTKIALSSVAYFLGAEVVQASRFDAVRNFVVQGAGERHALVRFSEDTKFKNTVWAPFQNESGDVVVSFRLVLAEFLIDLSPAEDQFQLLEAKQREFEGESGWCVLPARS